MDGQIGLVGISRHNIRKLFLALLAVFLAAPSSGTLSAHALASGTGHPEVYGNGFPVISIEVNFPTPFDWNAVDAWDLVDFRENWHPATLTITNTSEQFELDGVDVRARGRGNSTWWVMSPKRPVRFRFPNNSHHALFDSPHAGRDWVTFANTADASHMRPGAEITREAMAAFLFQFAGSPDFEPPAASSFWDVPETSPFFTQIEWLQYTGIAAGWPDGSFGPGDSITREATAAFLFRAAEIGGGFWGVNSGTE